MEITLPQPLRHLVGLSCRVTVRDGARPEVVLEPDMAPARSVFTALWPRMAALLLHEDAPVFPVQDFHFTLEPSPCAPGRPSLCWQDGLALAGRGGAPDAASMARVVAAFGTAMAEQLGIVPVHGPRFGAVCGMLAAGVRPFAEWQEPTDIAACLLSARLTWQPGQPWRESLADENLFWALCGPGFGAAADLFAAWSGDESEYARLSANWRLGRSFEMTQG